MSHLPLKAVTQKTSIPIYPGLEALPILCEETYKALGGQYKHLTDVISPAVYNYYIAVLAYCRLLYLHRYNNGIISNEERKLLDDFLPCKVPAVISKYLMGFGNVELEYSNLLFYLLPRPMMALPFSFNKQPSEAWFGKINEATHYLYAMYPSLFVHFQSILEDLQCTFSGTESNWNLPYFMSPMGMDMDMCKPTLNLLGYKPAVHLGYNHINFLRNLGITLPLYQTYTQNVMDLWRRNVRRELMFVVSDILSKHVSNLSRVPLQTYGMKTQIPFQQPSTVNRPLQKRYLDYVFHNISPHQLDPSVAYQGASFVYRLRRTVDFKVGSTNPWCICEFNNFSNVPLKWKQTANTAREMEMDVLNKHRFQSHPYVVQERIKTLVSNN